MTAKTRKTSKTAQPNKPAAAKQPAETATTRPTTGPKSETAERVERRPRKADNGHTLVRLTTWTGRSGRQMGRFDCQCGKSLEIYGDAERVEQSHARHVAKTAKS